MEKIRRFKKVTFGGVALLTALSISVAAYAQLSKAGASTAGFHALGPAGLKIDGKTSELAVADDGTTVTVTVPLGKIETGIGLRDKHTKEYLEVQKYPNAELRVARSAIKFPAAGAESSGDVKGKLTVHGQSKDVTFHYKAKRDGSTYAVAGTARVNMNDFGVKTPSYLGVSVKPDVEVFANFQVQDN